MLTVLSVALATLLTIAALRKLSHRDAVARSYARVGVRAEQLPALAVILLTAAAGLLAGLRWPPLGRAAALGLVAYFALAVAAHVRFHDERNLAAPLLILALATTVLVLQLS